jgi:hypothetical protein
LRQSREILRKIGKSKQPRPDLAKCFGALAPTDLSASPGREKEGVISDEQYQRLMVKRRQPKSIVRFFRGSPLAGLDLDLERDKDTGRDIEL